MGRELRRVPPNWNHPQRTDGSDDLQPMYDRNFDVEFAQWLTDFDRIRRGDLTDFEREVYSGPNPLAEWVNDEGYPPDPAYHRPWKDEEATWFQVWETVSEGTPVTPPFATKEELVEYLVTNGDFWDQARLRRGSSLGRKGWTREAANSFVHGDGWAPSFVVRTHANGRQESGANADGLTLLNKARETP